MKKIITAFLVFFTLAVPYAKGMDYDEVYCSFDFGEGLYPEYTAVSGEWKTGNKNDNNTWVYSFDEREEDFLPISGKWSFSDGKYIQSQVGLSSLTRSMLGKKTDGFDMQTEITPLSDDNTFMIYFASQNGEDGYSIEINSYQSKLIANGGEYIGKGGILKDNTYKVRLVAEKNTLTLYLDREVIFRKTDMPDMFGRVGIGSWNSAFEFDNMVLSSIPSLGSSNKLIGDGKKSFILFSDTEGENYAFSAKLAAEDFQAGTAGIAVRASEEGGYFLGLDSNGAYITKKIGGKKLARADFKPRSGVIYELTAECYDDDIKFYVDGKELISMRNSDFKIGSCGFFADKTKAYYENASIRILRKPTPPIVSEGNTTYYINSENGDDLKDGTSEETAWKSLHKLRDVKLAAGDRVLLKRGQPYSGVLYLNDLEVGEAITISAYGSGENPVIEAYTTGIAINNCRGIDISEIDVLLRHYGASELSRLGMGCGVRLANSTDITFSNCGFVCATDGAYTAAMDADSVFCLPRCENVSYSGFFYNSACVNGEESTAEDGADEHWAHKYMSILVEKNIISEYRPDDKITRAEFASMLVSALGLEESGYRGIFNDVTADMWYANKLQTISDYRLFPLEMTENKEASADCVLKRAELAAIAVLALGNASCEEVELADRNGIEPWMIRYINSAVSQGVMSLDDVGCFNAANEVTRAEASVVLIKLMEKIL